MRYIVIVILFLYGNLLTGATLNSKDSLIMLLDKSSDPTQKVSVYRNLADIFFEEPEEINYLKKTYQESQKIGRKDMMLDALSDLTMVFVKKEQMDSARYYMRIIANSGTKKMTEDKLIYLELKMFDLQITSKDNEKSLEEYLKPSKVKSQNIYQQLKQAYITGSALFYTKKLSESIPYYKTALKLCTNIPEKERSKLEILVLWQLAHVYTRNNEVPKAFDFMEELIKKQEDYYYKYYKPERPFYNINTRYIQNYTFFFTGINLLSENKARLYLKRLLEYSKNSTNPADKYCVFLAFNNYHLFHKDYQKAIATNDSLIKYAKIIAQYNLPGLYGTEALIYSLMGKYKEAYNYLKLSHAMKDSLMTEVTNQQISELQVKYNVDKLNHEKTLLEIKNKRITVICLSSILFVFIGICLYQYFVLKKEKKMKKELRRLNIKSEESEKMKTAFINSVCHEIRTPLNAIVGFSELALDDSIDIDIKKTFPEEIQKNTVLLTSLINDMLVVSNLDSSKEELPRAPENLNNICIHEMDKLKTNRKKNIEYILNLSEDNPVISTHSKYLALVLEHLLDNANKFTEQGHIAITYRIDKAKKELFLNVEDTGCGIPAGKHDFVFERFSKLNSFKQGNGLGLYLCMLIVKRLSGKLYIDPEYTQGARFIIQLPI